MAGFVFSTGKRLKRAYPHSTITGRWLLRLCALALLVILAWVVGRSLALLQQSESRQAVGLSLLQAGKGDQAAYVFDQPVWQGVAHYRAGNLQRAAAAFAHQDSVLARYNLAGSLARLGDYNQAIRLYRGVLQDVPEHADAAANLELVMAAALAAERQGEAQSQQRDESAFRSGIETSEQTEAPPASENDQPLDKTVSDQNSSDENSEQQGAPQTPDRDMPRQQNAAVHDGGDSSQSPPFAPKDNSAAGRVNNPLEDSLPDADGRAIGANRLQRHEERQMAEQILLREIRDDPVIVLRARLKSIHEQRREIQ